MGVFERFIEWLNGLNYALGEAVQGQLDAGSPLVVLFVFLAGVVTSFTPCVYPVIPVTVTYIGGSAGGSRRRAVTLSVVYVTGLLDSRLRAPPCRGAVPESRARRREICPLPPPRPG